MQQFLTYGLSQLEMQVSAEQIAMYKTGMSPADWRCAPDIPHLLTQLQALPDRFAADYAKGRFRTFRPYKTSTGVRLKTIEAAIAFKNFHEGLHLGAILALRNLVDLGE